MRVAIFVSDYHRRGGFPRHGTHLATALYRMGHDVTVYTRSIEADDRDAGIEFRTYSTVKGPLLLHMAYEPWRVTKLAREAADEFDVILSVGLPCLAPVVLFGPGTHRGYFVTSKSLFSPWAPRRIIEALRPFHRIVMFWEKKMLDGLYPRLVVVPNEALASEYTDLYRFPRNRVVLLPHMIDPDEFTFDPHLRAQTRDMLGVPEGTALLLWVGGRGRQKGLDVLADALKLLPRGAPWVAAFAGDGSAGKSLAARTARLVREGRVRLLGRVPDVRALYCASDLLVFPSRYDPWGLVATEALTCGLPVMVSANIGAAMAVREGENGFLLHSKGDPSELRDGIIEFLRTGGFDRQRVAQTVHWLDPHMVVEGLEGILAKVADEKERVPA